MNTAARNTDTNLAAGLAGRDQFVVSFRGTVVVITDSRLSVSRSARETRVFVVSFYRIFVDDHFVANIHVDQKKKKNRFPISSP